MGKDRHMNWGLLAALFFAVAQLITLSHAAEAGDEPHEHDGVICVLSVLNDDEDPVLPPIGVKVLVPGLVPARTVLPSETARTCLPTANLPPSTGPPAR